MSTKYGFALDMGIPMDAQTAYYMPRAYDVSVTPTAVPAQAIDEQTVTVTGVETNMAVSFSPPAQTTEAAPVSARVSADDTVAIMWMNPTGGTITPSGGTFKIVAHRVATR